MDKNKLKILKQFIAFCKQELSIQTLPKITLIDDKNFVEQFRSFGEYNPVDQTIKIFYSGRNLADVCRSLAHELTHHRQNELNLIYNQSGETGSEIENDANAMAGIIMRDFGKMNVNVYDLNSIINEEIKIALYPGKRGVDTDFNEKDIADAPKVQIPLDMLVRNEPAVKMKKATSIENIKKLAAMYKKGKKMDPILVRKKGDKFQILDGHHRYTAAKLAGLDSINAIVVPEKNITPVDKKGNPLNEIGEGIKAFPWEFEGKDGDGNYWYDFDTDEYHYQVGIADLEEGMYDLSFNVTTLDGDADTPLDTNEGVVLKVMSTVTEITKDFIAKADPQIVIFRPIKTKEGEDKEKDQRRFRLYGAYLKKHLPSNYNLMTTGDAYRIIKK